MVKAGTTKKYVSFAIADFQTVLNCEPDNIIPYYPPPEGGKLVSLIGPELTALYNTYIATGNAVSNDIFQIFDTSVLIEIFPLDGQYTELLNLLITSYELTDVIPDPDMKVIIGKIPINVLLSLNLLTTYINYAVPVYPAIPTSGIVTSLGDVHAF